MGLCQKVPKFDFQSQFSLSKIIWIFLNFFIEQYNFWSTFLQLTFFDINFKNTLFSKMSQGLSCKMCQIVWLNCILTYITKVMWLCTIKYLFVKTRYPRCITLKSLSLRPFYKFSRQFDNLTQFFVYFLNERVLFSQPASCLWFSNVLPLIRTWNKLEELMLSSLLQQTLLFIGPSSSAVTAWGQS